MLKSLEQIQDCKHHLEEPWIKYLYKTKEKNFNVNNVQSLQEIDSHSVLNYVKKTLTVLDNLNNVNPIDSDILFCVEETLKWSEIAKTGNSKKRKEWNRKKYDLFVHNIGSAEIYKEYYNNEIIYQLIKTHGLVGQYIKGEIPFSKNYPLYELVKNQKIKKEKLKKILILLNHCIIEGVSKELYENVKIEVISIIDKILDGNFEEETDFITKLQRLNSNLNSEEIQYLQCLCVEIETRLKKVFARLELWYYDSALKGFTIEEQIKILLLVYNKLADSHCHLTFELLMHDLYLEYQNKKEINIYKKRIIESYLKEISFEQIMSYNINPNPHISFNIKEQKETLIFQFIFSTQASKLIEFCEVANTSDSLYQKSIYMLYDLFGFRRDAYDRFYNEIEYLNTMNKSLNQKSIVLNYMVGNTVLDVGPGGGALMDLIEEKFPTKKVMGIDLSQNVIDALNLKKQKEKHQWEVVKGDALKLDEYFQKNSIDTIIYSSIIHELYSYIENKGKKFDKETIRITLQSAYAVLSKKGRIIIRDGIMTEPKEQYRIIEFKNKGDIAILERYCHDFEGRKVTYQKVSETEVKMLVNDAMEFLYTYTWGESSYPLEIKEQFGYFTPTEYIDFIKESLENCNIIECNAFLQDGYEENLLPKINIYDENHKVIKLPNSTCIIIIEKR